MPREILGALRLGRLVALRKPNGGVGGAGWWRGRWRSSVRFALRRQRRHSNRAGTECVTHIVQALTDLNARTTVMSVDGIGAYDLISRETMLSAVRDLELRRPSAWVAEVSSSKSWNPASLGHMVHVDPNRPSNVALARRSCCCSSVLCVRTLPFLTCVPSSSVFIVPGKTIWNGRRGWASVAALAGWYEVIRGPRLGVPSRRNGAKAQGTPRCLCPVHEGVGVKVLRNMCVNQRQSGRSAGGGFEQDHQVAVGSGSSRRGRRYRKERVGGCAQESASRSRGSTSVGADRVHTEVHRAREETGGACRRVRSVGTRVIVECEKELLEAEERLARLRVEVERPTALVPDPGTEVQRLQHQLAQAQAQLLHHGCTSVTAGSTAKRPRRREDFVCSYTEEVIEWMSDRQMDIQEEIVRGNAADVARLSSFGGSSSDEFTATPTFHGGAFCPSASEFIWSRKCDDSVIGRSARSAAQYGHLGSRVGEANNPGPPKSLLRRRGPVALPSIRIMVPRVEQSQMSTVVDSDEDPLLPREVRSQFQSEASPGHIEVRTPPTRATQLEDVTNSLGAAMGLDSLPSSVSDVDHEAISDPGDSTFFGQIRKRSGRRLPSGGHDRSWW